MELQREVGRHDAQIENLQMDMKQVMGDVHEIKLMLAEAKGSWRTLMAVGGVAAFVGASAAKILAWFAK